MGDLDGRVALVTGSGRGIGRAIAARLAADGASVVVNDVDEDVAREAAAGIDGAAVAVGSVADPAVTDALVETAEREFGALDLVVNNAGVTRDAMVHRMSDDEWSLVLDVSLRGTFNVCRSAARLLRNRDASHNRKVVNVSSINGIYGVAGNVVVDVVDDHRGAVRREPCRDCLADAPARPGDQRHPTVEVSHQ